MNVLIKNIIQIFTVILILVYCLFISCGHHSATEPELIEYEPSLIGSWNWIKSQGGIAGELLTPESTGWTVDLTFTGDYMRFSRNDTTLVEGVYTLEIPENPDTQWSSIYINDNLVFNYRFPDFNCLLLMDPVTDGYGHEFRKT
ncbi:hypothetical protein ACFL6G_05015 [candidate division KSB1 bacterium]